MTFSLQDVLAILAISLAVGAILIVMMNLSESRRGAREARLEIERMRRHYEEEIYGVTRRLLKTEDRWSDVNHLVLAAQEAASSSSSDVGVKASPDMNGSTEVPTFLRENGLTAEDMHVDPTLVFVLTPFSEQFREEFEVIRSACSEVGLRALRGDEENHSGDIFPHILRLIASSRIVIANLSGRNPNVLYELGICHALSKPVIIVTSELEGVPFDVQSKRLVLYQRSSDLRDAIRLSLTRTALGEK